MKKFLDLIASFALMFDVDWDKDFEDDAYVLARQEEERIAERPAITVVTTPVPSPAA